MIFKTSHGPLAGLDGLTTTELNNLMNSSPLFTPKRYLKGFQEK
jgi:hypothetical protein